MAVSTPMHLTNNFDDKSDKNGGTSVKSLDRHDGKVGGAGYIPSNAQQVEFRSPDICD